MFISPTTKSLAVLATKTKTKTKTELKGVSSGKWAKPVPRPACRH